MSRCPEPRQVLGRVVLLGTRGRVLLLVDGYDRRFEATFAGRDDVRALYSNASRTPSNSYWAFATRGLGLAMARDAIYVGGMLGATPVCRWWLVDVTFTRT